MAIPKHQPYYTVAEYLNIERSSTERYMYVDGEIFAMAGESDAHGDISTNLVGILYGQLKGKPCRVRSKDTKVRSGPKPKSPLATRGMFSYPDVLVICGEPVHLDERRDVILNPAVIIEVLSPTTEAFDRGDKFRRFQEWNPTLKDYLLVAQDRPRIEHYHREDDGSWTYRSESGLDARVVIEEIECAIPLADVYDRVDFPQKEDDQEDIVDPKQE